MLLATTTVEDVDRFLAVFGANGAEKRAAAKLDERHPGDEKKKRSNPHVRSQCTPLLGAASSCAHAGLGQVA